MRPVSRRTALTLAVFHTFPSMPHRTRRIWATQRIASCPKARSRY
ncbi:hypothetical protein COLSTE_00249 [Collinsella stercoris DSM 13279]|uniref:Uncharacterized protein n=1 Tax=Collinsella stercoris DSM 13279 TaxID=445975 RepID=B6G859_9ACTN|nr:hypothetical protein COLSTE_00249 [Collinsella stercoris DSM 13279]